MQSHANITEIYACKIQCTAALHLIIISTPWEENLIFHFRKVDNYTNLPRLLQNISFNLVLMN